MQHSMNVKRCMEKDLKEHQIYKMGKEGLITCFIKTQDAAA